MHTRLAAAALCATSFSALAADYELDPAHTFVYFAVRHADMAMAYGRFNKAAGTLSMDRENGTGSLQVTIDAASVDTNHKKRDDHVRSPDFLNAVEFPELTFTSTKITYNGDDQATVEGEFDMLGVSKPLTLNVTGITCGKHVIYEYDACGFHATATVKRSEYGMSYGLPSAVGDDFQLFLSSEAKKQ